MQPLITDGWRCDLEDPAELEAACLAWSPALRGDEPPVVYDLNDVIDWSKTEDQKQQGSCQGHSITTACEWAFHRWTGRVVELCRQYAYIASQKIDGISSDSGSSIAAGVKVAQNGLPREQWWPYTGRYDRSIPQACFDHLDFKLRDAYYLKTADDFYAFLARGVGIVHIGMQWRSSMSGHGLEVKDYGGGGGGGHAVVLGPLVGEPDADGRYKVPLHNSHGRRWGHEGFKLIWPRAIAQIFESSRFGAVGIGKVTGPARALPDML